MDNRHQALLDKQPKWLKRLHEWRVEHVSDKMFVLILAFLVGLLSAVAAWVLHGLINQIVALLTGKFEIDSYNWFTPQDARHSIYSGSLAEEFLRSFLNEF